MTNRARGKFCSNTRMLGCTQVFVVLLKASAKLLPPQRRANKPKLLFENFSYRSTVRQADNEKIYFFSLQILEVSTMLLEKESCAQRAIASTN